MQTGVHPRMTRSTDAHFVAPGDFAKIFDLNSVYSAGTRTEQGKRSQLIGRSRVAMSDIPRISRARPVFRQNTPKR